MADGNPNCPRSPRNPKTSLVGDLGRTGGKHALRILQVVGVFATCMWAETDVPLLFHISTCVNPAVRQFGHQDVQIRKRLRDSSSSIHHPKLTRIHLRRSSIIKGDGDSAHSSFALTHRCQLQFARRFREMSPRLISEEAFKNSTAKMWEI